jgi:hypothetical protein
VTHKIYALGGTSSVDINSIILDTYTKTMNQYLLEKQLVPQGQLTELAYDDFIKSPVTCMKAAYETLQLNDFSYCENKLMSFAVRQKEFKPIDHKLAPDELRMVSKKLEPLISHWNYPLL